MWPPCGPDQSQFILLQTAILLFFVHLCRGLFESSPLRGCGVTRKRARRGVGAGSGDTAFAAAGAAVAAAPACNPRPPKLPTCVQRSPAARRPCVGLRRAFYLKSARNIVGPTRGTEDDEGRRGTTGRRRQSKHRGSAGRRPSGGGAGHFPSVVNHRPAPRARPNYPLLSIIGPPRSPSPAACAPPLKPFLVAAAAHVSFVFYCCAALRHISAGDGGTGERGGQGVDEELRSFIHPLLHYPVGTETVNDLRFFFRKM